MKFIFFFFLQNNKKQKQKKGINEWQSLLLCFYVFSRVKGKKQKKD